MSLEYSVTGIEVLVSHTHMAGFTIPQHNVGSRKPQYQIWRRHELAPSQSGILVLRNKRNESIPQQQDTQTMMLKQRLHQLTHCNCPAFCCIWFDNIIVDSVRFARVGSWDEMKTLSTYNQCCLEITKQKGYRDKWVSDEPYFEQSRPSFQLLRHLVLIEA